MENSNESKSNVGQFKRILRWRAEEMGTLMRSSLHIVQLGGHYRFGPCSAGWVLCWPNWMWFLTCWGCTHVKGHHLIFSFTQVLQLPPTICRAKASVMEKASNISGPESPKNGAAAQHRRDSEVSFPSLGEAWMGKNLPVTKCLGSIWAMAQVHRLHQTRYDSENGLSSTGGAQTS